METYRSKLLYEIVHFQWDNPHATKTWDNIRLRYFHRPPENMWARISWRNTAACFHSNLISTCLPRPWRKKGAILSNFTLTRWNQFVNLLLLSAKYEYTCIPTKRKTLQFVLTPLNQMSPYQLTFQPPTNLVEELTVYRVLPTCAHIIAACFTVSCSYLHQRILNRTAIERLMVVHQWIQNSNWSDNEIAEPSNITSGNAVTISYQLSAPVVGHLATFW